MSSKEYHAENRVRELNINDVSYEVWEALTHPMWKIVRNSSTIASSERIRLLISNSINRRLHVEVSRAVGNSIYDSAFTSLKVT